MVYHQCHKNGLRVHCKSDIALATSSVLEISIKRAGTAYGAFTFFGPYGAEDIYRISVYSNDNQKLQEASSIILEELFTYNRHCIKSQDGTVKDTVQKSMCLVGRLYRTLRTSVRSFR